MIARSCLIASLFFLENLPVSGLHPVRPNVSAVSIGNGAITTAQCEQLRSDVVDGVGRCLVSVIILRSRRVRSILFPYNDEGSSVSNLYAAESILASAEGTNKNSRNRWMGASCGGLSVTRSTPTDRNCTICAVLARHPHAECANRGNVAPRRKPRSYAGAF